MSLDLYLGPMFAGKSSAAIGLIRRNAIIGRRTLCITSQLDTRYTNEPQIVSHNMEMSPAVAVATLKPLLETASFADAACIIVEEAQFFPDLKEFVLKAVEEHGKHVVCVGLDGDAERKPFGALNELLPYCDSVQKFKALCKQCGDGTAAIFTHRFEKAPQQISVGDGNQYAPLCRRHYLEAR
jgi:thymidine kinase